MLYAKYNAIYACRNILYISYMTFLFLYLSMVSFPMPWIVTSREML